MTAAVRGAQPSEPPDAWLDLLATLIADAPVNLVSRGDRADVRRLHVDEAVQVAQHLTVAPGARWMDLGTGGGLPGLVLARMYADTQWTLLDARAKKIRLVEAFARALDVGNVHAVHARAEDLARSGSHAGSYGGVISRAVGSLTRTVALARPFVGHGEIIAVRGLRAAQDADALAPWRDRLGVSVDEVATIDGTIRPTALVRVRGHGPVPPAFSRMQRTILRSTQGGSDVGSA